jgi:hypothetical protein
MYPNDDLAEMMKFHPALQQLFREAAAAARKVDALEARLARARLEYSRADAACHAYRQELQRQQDSKTVLIDPAVNRAFAPTQS